MRAWLIASEACPGDGPALADEVGVPQRAVLVGEDDECPVGGGAGGPAGLDQQHEAEKPRHLRFVGHHFGQQACQSDGLGAEILAEELIAEARGVPFVED